MKKNKNTLKKTPTMARGVIRTPILFLEGGGGLRMTVVFVFGKAANEINNQVCEGKFHNFMTIKSKFWKFQTFSVCL